MSSCDARSIQLSWRFLIVFKVGVPIVMTVLVVNSLINWPANGFHAIELFLFCVLEFVVVFAGWWSARLVWIRIKGDRIYIRRWFGSRVFPLSDLSEVSVNYRKGIAWAVFRLSDRESSRVLKFNTMLKPDRDYGRTGMLADLAILEGTTIRYKDCWGRERG